VTTSYLYHFSEDAGIDRFVPHVPATNPDHPPCVWAIDEAHAPLYWFPRECPRGTVWANDREQRLVLAERFLTTAKRLHVTELRWLERMRATKLFVYTFDAAPFSPWPEADGQWTATTPVTPIDVQPAGDLLALHASAEIELRFVTSLRPFWDAVVGSGLPFSGVRLRAAIGGPR
jgi:hypothetical protein